MFVDSDFNGNSFGSFDTDATLDNSNYANASGYSNASGTMGTSSPYFSVATKYAVNPSVSQFKAKGVMGCSSWMSMVTCSWLMKLSKYGSDSKVTSAFNSVAKSKNSYGYGLSEMTDALNGVAADISSLVPFTSNMSCSEYVAILSSLNSTLSSWNSAAVTHLYDRDLRAEYLSAIATALGLASSYMDARDCNGSTSAIDTAQAAAAASAAAQDIAQADAAQAAADSAAAQAQAAADSAAAQAQAAKESQDAQSAALRKINASKTQNAQALQALEDEASENRIAAQEEKAASDKKNKMIMFGAGIVILILIIKK